MKSIAKGDLVAEFAKNDQIIEGNHFLRNNSFDANCECIGQKVFARTDVPADTELTLYYHGILL